MISFRWAVLAVLTYWHAALAVRCPPELYLLAHPTLMSKLTFCLNFENSSIYLGDILILFSIFSLFRLLKKHNNSQYTIPNIL